MNRYSTLEPISNDPASYALERDYHSTAPVRDHALTAPQVDYNQKLPQVWYNSRPQEAPIYVPEFDTKEHADKSNKQPRNLGFLRRPRRVATWITIGLIVVIGIGVGVGVGVGLRNRKTEDPRYYLRDSLERTMKSVMRPPPDA
ncbi:MAG: hypothetical protein MMC23_001797 [Stictis urceolatum]|nr:hypothetical protein [Stictis urceolata]